MAGNRDLTRELLTAFFNQAYAPGSLSGGILQASRPNNSVEWNESEDTRRSEKNVEKFVKNFDVAAEILASRNR